MTFFLRSFRGGGGEGACETREKETTQLRHFRERVLWDVLDAAGQGAGGGGRGQRDAVATAREAEGE